MKTICKSPVVGGIASSIPRQRSHHCASHGFGLSLNYSFNATRMLEMLRGKRLMFVGDSLNRGQYVSMVCLLNRIIPESAKSMETVDSLTVFRAKVYPCPTFCYISELNNIFLLQCLKNFTSRLPLFSTLILALDVCIL